MGPRKITPEIRVRETEGREERKGIAGLFSAEVSHV
jgi:hypothetical protein